MNTPSDSLLMATTANLMVLSRAYRGAADKALADYGLSQATAWPVILAGRLGDGVRQGALAEALGVEGPFPGARAGPAGRRRPDGTARRPA